jgi:hypothetical protein
MKNFLILPKKIERDNLQKSQTKPMQLAKYLRDPKIENATNRGSERIGYKNALYLHNWKMQPVEPGLREVDHGRLVHQMGKTIDNLDEKLLM